MSISNITFVDIESVQQYCSYDDAPPDHAEAFTKRYESEILKMIDNTTDIDAVAMEFSLRAKQLYARKSSLHAEFGKVVAISIGKFVPGKTHEESKFYIRNLASRHEVELLTQASESILKAAGLLCAHNGMDFDFPFLMRRYMINGIAVPAPLNVAGVKPWDIKLEDTMKMWSGTQWNYKVSLDLLANVFGLPSPKKDMDGSDVANIYYDSFSPDENELPFEKESAALKKIGDYCGSDVFCLANVYSKMKGFPIINEDQIIYV